MHAVPVAVVVALLGWAPGAFAHDVRPAYLQIDEGGPGRYDILWRTPTLSGMPLPVALQLPAEARNVTEPHTQQLADSLQIGQALAQAAVTHAALGRGTNGRTRENRVID